MFVFGEKTVSTPPGYPGRKNLWAVAFWLTAEEKNIKFSVPFGAVLKGDVMKAIKMDDDVQAATEYEKTP